MKQQLLLLQDVHALGRSGEIVTVKSGFARNFLVPKKKAVVADKNTLRMQERLKEERAKQAEVDRKESEILAAKIEGKTITIEVKVDPEGHLYGSVATHDIIELLEKEGISLSKRDIKLAKPIKETGTFPINVKLKEGVQATFILTVMVEGGVALAKAAEEAAAKEEAEKQDENPEEESSDS